MSAVTEAHPVPETEYASVFAQWDRRAWVRAKPRRDVDFEPDRDYFPAALTPLRRAAAAVGTTAPGLARRLGVHQLCSYLSFTIHVELGVVNPATALLYDGALGLVFPDGIRRDALRVYTDEGAHAEMCHSFVSSVVETTGIATVEHEPAFVGRLRLLRRTHPDVPAELFTLFAAVVSETLTTPVLTAVPHDATVQPSVRLLVDDHARDERRHFAFFRSVFAMVWPRLSREHRRAVALLVPELIHAFLDPDVPTALEVLRRCEDMRNAEACIAGLLVDDSAGRTLRQSAVHLVRLLDEHDAFADEAIRVAFAEAGLP